MSTEELELFKQMLGMLGSAGDASIWLIVGWWGVSILKMVLILSFIGWIAYYLINCIRNSVAEVGYFVEWGKRLETTTKYGTCSLSPREVKLKVDEFIRKELGE